MLIENLTIPLDKPYDSANYWLGHAVVTEALTSNLAKTMGVKAQLLVEINNGTWHVSGTLLFSHARGNRGISVSTDAHNISCTKLSYVHNAAVATIELGIDDAQINALLNTLLGEDEQSHLRWFIGKAFETNTNPLPVLRKMLPGEWEFKPSARGTKASVWFGGALVWAGNADTKATGVVLNS